MLDGHAVMMVSLLRKGAIWQKGWLNDIVSAMK